MTQNSPIFSCPNYVQFILQKSIKVASVTHQLYLLIEEDILEFLSLEIRRRVEHVSIITETRFSSFQYFQ